MAQALQSWLLPAALTLLGAIGIILFLRLLLLPLRAVRRSVQHARGESTDARLLRPLDALCLTTGATALCALTGTATAVALGGPGAVTWVILGGLASSAIRYAEAAVSWQHRTLYDDGRRMSASLAPLLRGLSPKAGRPLAIAYGVLTILAIALSIGAAGSADLGRELGATLGAPARWVPVALGAVALGLAFRPPAKTARLLHLPVLAVLALTVILFLVAALAGASRMPGALGRMLEQAFTGGAPAAGFLGALWSETFRLGLSRGLLSGSALGVAAAIHGGSGAQSAHRAGLVASLEPLAASVLLPLVIGLAVVSTRAWNTQHDMSAPLAATRAFLREPASAAELESDELALDGIIRVREGQSFDRFYLAVHRGLVNEPRFQLDGKPWDGAVRFEDGRVSSLLEPTGRFGALDRVDLAKAERIAVVGEGPLVGAPLLGRALTSYLPAHWGGPVTGVLLVAFGLIFAFALVLAADALGGGLAGAKGALGARVLAALAIATAPLWVRAGVADLLPVAAVLAAIPYAIGLATCLPRVTSLEDDESRGAKAGRR
jgi:AGCS family alanine or glycine:cation symporter